MAKRLPEVPGWAVALVLGGAAVGVGGYVLYEWLVGPRRYWEELYKRLLDDYVREYVKFVQESGGALTAEQEGILKEKQERLAEVEWNLRQVTKSAQDLVNMIGWGTVAGIVIAALGVAAPRIARAIKYLRDSSANAKTTEGLVPLVRCTVNVALADLGYVNLAAAAQVHTNHWAEALLYPSMQARMSYLQAQMAQLVGVQLMIAAYVASALSVQMAVLIPAMLRAATAILLPPPIIP